MNIFDAGGIENSLVLAIILMRQDGLSWEEIDEVIARAHKRVEWSENHANGSVRL